MHRRLLAALMTLCLLLPASGCGGSGAEMEFEELRGKLGGAAVELGALVTDCSGGGGGTEYRLRCVSGAEGSELEVLAPAEIAGVRARLGAEGGAALEFEGLVPCSARRCARRTSPSPGRRARRASSPSSRRTSTASRSAWARTARPFTQSSPAHRAGKRSSSAG